VGKANALCLLWFSYKAYKTNAFVDLHSSEDERLNVDQKGTESTLEINRLLVSDAGKPLKYKECSAIFC